MKKAVLIGLAFCVLLTPAACVAAWVISMTGWRIFAEAMGTMLAIVAAYITCSVFANALFKSALLDDQKQSGDS